MRRTLRSLLHRALGSRTRLARCTSPQRCRAQMATNNSLATVSSVGLIAPPVVRQLGLHSARFKQGRISMATKSLAQQSIVLVEHCFVRIGILGMCLSVVTGGCASETTHDEVAANVSALDDSNEWVADD